MSKALDDIAAERQRQINVECWTPGHDDQHYDGSLARAAAAYALSGSLKSDYARSSLKNCTFSILSMIWPASWRFNPTSPRRDLVKAGALIVAEIERLDRRDNGSY